MEFDRGGSPLDASVLFRHIHHVAKQPFGRAPAQKQSVQDYHALT
jgi:hypothetical protein